MHIETYEEGIAKNHAEAEHAKRLHAKRYTTIEMRAINMVEDCGFRRKHQKAHYAYPSQQSRSQTRSRSRSYSSRHQSRVQHGRWHDTHTSSSPTSTGQRDSFSQPFAKGREGYDGAGWAAWFLKFLGLSKGSAK